MSKIDAVLKAYASGEPKTYRQIMQESGVDRMATVTVYAGRLMTSGLLERNGYIYNKTGRIALFQITQEGLDKLGMQSDNIKPKDGEIEGETTVARAIRTSPNSVFNLAFF